MQRHLLAWCVLFIGLSVLFLAPVSRAQEVHIESVQPPIRFLSLNTKQEDTKIEPSAVEPIGDGKLLLVADDENKSLIVVEALTGQITQQLKLSNFDKKPKWEAMARDFEGAYYVIGSHSVKDPTEEDAQQKLKDRSRLFRFRLKGGGADGAPLTIDEVSLVEWNIMDALAIEGYSSDPSKNKVKIEGLAVRTRQDATTSTTVRELVIGLRQPDEPVRVYAADITQLPGPNAKLTLRPLFRFYAGNRGTVRSQLSSIEYLPTWNGFLLLTSTEDISNHFHGNTLWFLPDEKISAASPTNSQLNKLKLSDLQLVEPQKVWVFGVDSKAEGLCVLSEEAGSGKTQTRHAHLALVYDNDTETTGIAGSLQFFTLVLWPK
jgi:hypothetical protein